MALMDTSIIVSIAGVLVSALISFIVANIRIGEYKNKVDTHASDIRDLKDEHKEVRDKVIACETSLKEREPLGRRKSPVALTDRGNKVLLESGGKDFIDESFAELNGMVDAMNPRTSYDVQEDSKKVIEALTSDVRINPLKEYLFKEGMELEDIVFVLGIYLRDKILESKKWNMDDIDIHDPKRKT